MHELFFFHSLFDTYLYLIPFDLLKKKNTITLFLQKKKKNIYT